jgi:hypothetical protein
MAQPRITVRCFMCGSDFQMGPHRYEGQHIPRYNIDVCGICYKTNWDGWGPYCEERLIEHLKQQDIPIPRRNKKGWLPRD